MDLIKVTQTSTDKFNRIVIIAAGLIVLDNYLNQVYIDKVSVSYV